MLAHIILRLRGVRLLFRPARAVDEGDRLLNRSSQPGFCAATHIVSIDHCNDAGSALRVLKDCCFDAQGFHLFWFSKRGQAQILCKLARKSGTRGRRKEVVFEGRLQQHKDWTPTKVCLTGVLHEQTCTAKWTLRIGEGRGGPVYDLGDLPSGSFANVALISTTKGKRRKMMTIFIAPDKPDIVICVSETALLPKKVNQEDTETPSMTLLMDSLLVDAFLVDEIASVRGLFRLPVSSLPSNPLATLSSPSSSGVNVEADSTPNA